MNLVKQMTDQLSGDVLDKLSALLGADNESTERAATAAVPSLLSALAGMTTTSDGANKLTKVLGGLDPSSLGSVANLLGGDAGSLLSKGTGLLGSLFSSNMLSGLTNSLSRFSGLSPSVVKTLLGYLSPFVLGKIAGQWKTQGGSVQALKSLFADQRENIARAVPAGFSLADITEAAPPVQAYVPERRVAAESVAATPSVAKWAIPLGLALLGGFLLWQVLRPRERVVEARAPRTTDEVVAMKPALPDVVDEAASLTVVRDDLGGLFRSMETTFADITDATSAERALPALNDLSTKIDDMNRRLARLPKESLTALRPVIEKQSSAIVEKANEISSIDGIGAQIKTLLQEIVAKIARWIA